MFDWNNIKKSINELADKTVSKTIEVTDVASTKVKIASKETDRETEYRRLGKLAYYKLKGVKVSNADELENRISDSIARIDNLNKEIAALKADEEAKKEERKSAAEAKRAAEKAAQDAEEEIVMEQFNEARRTANEEYEKAKKAAEDARKQE